MSEMFIGAQREFDLFAVWNNCLLEAAVLQGARLL